MQNETIGIWCEKDRNLYYLETNGIRVGSAIDRVVSTLAMRGLISSKEKMKWNQREYKLMSIRDAKKEGFEIVPIFMNSHIRKSKEAADEENKNPWASA